MCKDNKKPAVKATAGKAAKRVKTPSFVIELPLRTSIEDERLLNDRMLCGSRLHNVLLADGIEMVDGMRSDPEWKAAKKIKDKDRRRDAFDAVKDAHHFNSSHLDALAAKHAHGAGFYGRIGSHEMQAIARRVFNALAKWVYGTGGRPRFKGRKRMLHSIEGKNNKGMLQWLPLEKVFQVERDWKIEVILPDLKKDEWMWTALQSKTKYCRIVWRRVGAIKRWYVQLIQTGLAPIKAKLLAKLAGEGTVGGIDLGPSTLAWCTPTDAGLKPLCPEIDRPEKQIRQLQRHIDRQRRAANPDNFKADGTIKKGKKKWVMSNRQRAANADLADLHRREAAVRRNSHGKLINFLLEKARHWKDDGVSPKALQRRYGKSSGECATATHPAC